ncbi:MAG: hypothetical protein ACP5LE_03215 [Thermoplasmata archaeon]
MDELNARIENFNRILEKYREIGFKVGNFNINTPSAVPIAERFENFEKIMRNNLKGMIVHELVELERQVENTKRMGLHITVDTELAQELDRICEREDVLNEDTVAKVARLRNEVKKIHEQSLAETNKIIEKLRKIEANIEIFPQNTRNELLSLIRRAYERFEAKRYYEVWFTAKRVIEEYEGKMYGGFIAKLNELTARINSMKSLGVDVSHAESLLILAKAQFESREIEKANENIEKCKQILTETENRNVLRNIESFENYLKRASEVIYIDPSVFQRVENIKEEARKGNIEVANANLKKEIAELEHALNLTVTNLTNAWERDVNAAGSYGIPVNSEEWKKIRNTVVADRIEGIKRMREFILSIEKEIERKRSEYLKASSLAVPQQFSAPVQHPSPQAQPETKASEPPSASQSVQTPLHITTQPSTSPSPVPQAEETQPVPIQTISQDLKSRIDNFNLIVAKYMESGVKLRLFDPQAPSKVPIFERFETYEKIMQNNLKAFLTHELIDYERNIDNAKKINLVVDENPLLVNELEKAIESDGVLSMAVAEKAKHLRELSRNAQRKIEREAHKAIADLKFVEEMLNEIPLDKEYIIAQINKAKERYEAKRYYEAYILANKLLKEVEGKTFGLLIPRIEKASRLISELKTFGMETARAEELLRNARERYDAKDFVHANVQMDECEREIHRIITANITSSIEKFENYAKELDQIMKVDADIWLKIERMRKAISYGNTDEAMELLNVEMEKLENKVGAFVENLMLSITNTIECAAIAGKKIENAVLENLKSKIEQNRIAGIKETVEFLNECQTETKRNLIERIKELELLINTLVDEHKKNEFNAALQPLVEKVKTLPFTISAFSEWLTDINTIQANLTKELEQEIIPKLENLRKDFKFLESRNFKIERVPMLLKELESIIAAKNLNEAKNYLATRTEEISALTREFIEQSLAQISQKITEMEIYRVKLDAEKEELKNLANAWIPGKLQEIYEKIEELNKNYMERLNERVKEKVAKAKRNIPLLYELEISPEIYEEYLKNAEECIGRGEYMEALRNLMHLSEAYGKIKQRIMRGTEELRTKAVTLTELGVMIPEMPDLVLKIQGFVDDEEFEGGYKLLKENLAKFEILLQEKVTAEIKSIEEGIVELKKFGTVSETLNIAYDMAKNLASEKKYKEAKVFIVRCRTLISQESMKMFEMEFTDVNQMLKAASARGIDITTPAAYLNNFKREIAALHFHQAKWFIETARRMLDEEIKKLAKSELQGFSDVVNLYSPIFGKEFFTTLQKKLGEVIELYQTGKYLECIDKSKRIKEEISQTLSERIRKELINIKAIFEKFERYGVDFDAVKPLYAECSAYLDADKVQEALYKLRDCKNNLVQILREFLKIRYEDVEELMATAEKMGGSIAKYTEAMENARHLIEEEDFIDAVSVIDGIGKEVASQIHSIVYRKILDINNGISSIIEAGIPVDEEVKRHRDLSSTALASGQYFDAMDEIELAKGFLARNIKSFASEKLKETTALMETGRVIGCEMKETTALMSELEKAINSIDITKVSVLFKQLESVPKMEIEKHLSNLIAEATELTLILQEYGSPHESAKEIIQHASNQLSWKNYTEAYYSIQRIRPLLTTELKEKIKAEIEKAEKIVRTLENLGIPASNIKEELARIKLSIEHQSVKEIVSRIREIKRMLEDANTNNAESLKKATERVLATLQIEIARWEKLGLEAEEIYGLLKKVSELFNAHNYIEAAGLGYAVEETFVKAMEYRLRKVMENVKQKGALARKLGVKIDLDIEPLLSFTDYSSKQKMEERCSKLVEVEKVLDVENLVKVKALYMETERALRTNPSVPQGYLLSLERAKSMINTGKYLEAYVLIERCRNLVGMR